MGFSLDGYVVCDAWALATYEALVPGVLRHVTYARQPGFVASYVLPMVSDLELDQAWRDFPFDEIKSQVKQLGMTQARLLGDLPMEQLNWEEFDYLLAWLMSLMSERGVALVRDDTHGGVLIDEYAICIQRGEYVCAQGMNHYPFAPLTHFGVLPRSRREPFKELDPISNVLTVMDERFKGLFLFDGYLPRGLERAIWSPRDFEEELPELSFEQVMYAARNALEQLP